MAAYGLISCLSLMVLGSAMGRLVDTLPRDKMMAAAVITQNFAISLSCLILALYFGVGFCPHENSYKIAFLLRLITCRTRW